MSSYRAERRPHIGCVCSWVRTYDSRQNNRNAMILAKNVGYKAASSILSSAITSSVRMLRLESWNTIMFSRRINWLITWKRVVRQDTLLPVRKQQQLLEIMLCDRIQGSCGIPCDGLTWWPFHDKMTDGTGRDRVTCGTPRKVSDRCAGIDRVTTCMGCGSDMNITAHDSLQSVIAKHTIVFSL